MFGQSPMMFHLFVVFQRPSVKEQCPHCLRDFSLDEIISHSSNCSQKKDEPSLVRLISFFILPTFDWVQQISDSVQNIRPLTMPGKQANANGLLVSFFIIIIICVARRWIVKV